MANRTPHVVGGGLGTFRKEAQAKHAAQTKSEQHAAAMAAMRKVANAGK